jgi:hypothetical protein
MAKARRMTNTLSVFQAASPLASRGAAPPLPDRRRPLLPDSHGRRCRTATAGAAGQPRPALPDRARPPLRARTRLRARTTDRSENPELKTCHPIGVDISLT